MDDIQCTAEPFTVVGPNKHNDYFEALVLRGETIIAICRSPYADTCAENARLFRAAPEMVEALGYCQSWFESHSPTAECVDDVDREHPMLTCINSALARAPRMEDDSS